MKACYLVNASLMFDNKSCSLNDQVEKLKEDLTNEEESRCEAEVGDLLNPLICKSDQHLISPKNITSESNSKVTRIKEMITN